MSTVPVYLGAPGTSNAHPPFKTSDLDPKLEPVLDNDFAYRNNRSKKEINPIHKCRDVLYLSILAVHGAVRHVAGLYLPRDRRKEQQTGAGCIYKMASVSDK